MSSAMAEHGAQYARLDRSAECAAILSEHGDAARCSRRLVVLLPDVMQPEAEGSKAVRNKVARAIGNDLNTAVACTVYIPFYGTSIHLTVCIYGISKEFGKIIF